jgi:hypothetical protein
LRRSSAGSSAGATLLSIWGARPSRSLHSPSRRMVRTRERTPDISILPRSQTPLASGQRRRARRRRIAERMGPLAGMLPRRARHPAFCPKTGPLRILKQALRENLHLFPLILAYLRLMGKKGLMVNSDQACKMQGKLIWGLVSLAPPNKAAKPVPDDPGSRQRARRAATAEPQNTPKRKTSYGSAGASPYRWGALDQAESTFEHDCPLSPFRGWTGCQLVSGLGG